MGKTTQILLNFHIRTVEINNASFSKISFANVGQNNEEQITPNFPFHTADKTMQFTPNFPFHTADKTTQITPNFPFHTVGKTKQITQNFPLHTADKTTQISNNCFSLQRAKQRRFEISLNFPFHTVGKTTQIQIAPNPSSLQRTKQRKD